MLCQYTAALINFASKAIFDICISGIFMVYGSVFIQVLPKLSAVLGQLMIAKKE